MKETVARIVKRYRTPAGCQGYGGFCAARDGAATAPVELDNLFVTRGVSSSSREPPLAPVSSLKLLRPGAVVLRILGDPFPANSTDGAFVSDPPEPRGSKSSAKVTVGRPLLLCVFFSSIATLKVESDDMMGNEACFTEIYW